MTRPTMRSTRRRGIRASGDRRAVRLSRRGRRRPDACSRVSSRPITPSTRTSATSWPAGSPAGSIFGADLLDVPPQRRFYVGGGGTLRGFDYQSQSPHNAEGDIIGGLSYVAASAEARIKITDTIGVVPFVDVGTASAGDVPDLNDLGYRRRRRPALLYRPSGRCASMSPCRSIRRGPARLRRLSQPRTGLLMSIARTIASWVGDRIRRADRARRHPVRLHPDRARQAHARQLASSLASSDGLTVRSRAFPASSRPVCGSAGSRLPTPTARSRELDGLALVWRPLALLSAARSMSIGSPPTASPLSRQPVLPRLRAAATAPAAACR